MRISDSRRVLFVHVPKNAGSSIDWMFDHEVPDSRQFDGLPRHTVYRRFLKADPGLGDYWSFGFVRNPWSRMVSWYSMMAAIWARADAGDADTIAKIARHPQVWEPVHPYVTDFETFVVEGTRNIARFARPQRHWLVAADGREVDFIGRVENFAADLAVVRERLGLPPIDKLPRRNKTSHGHYREYYTPETRALVGELFAEDIEAFGYTFDEGTEGWPVRGAGNQSE